MRLSVFVLGIACSHAKIIFDNRRGDLKLIVSNHGKDHVPKRNLRILQQQEQDDDYETMHYELEFNSYCERAAADYTSRSNTTTCSCQFFGDGVIRLSCLENCLYCGGTNTTSITKSLSSSSSSCGQFSFLTDFADSMDFHVFSHTRIFRYDGSLGNDRDQVIFLEELDCPEFGPCNSCRVSVNGDQCNNCSICGDSGSGTNTSSGVIVDCENIASNASFNSCLAPPGPGLFEAFSYDIVECVAPPPPRNDYCADAVGLAPGEIVSGTMTGAVLEDDSLPFSCLGEGYRETYGIWFTFEGTGTPMLVSPCSHGELNPFPIILQGSGCQLLNCTERYSFHFTSCASRSDDRLETSVLLQTEPNMSYYVYISGLSGSFGAFDLTLTSYAEQENRQCIEASNITIDGGPIISTIEYGDSSGGLTFCSKGQAGGQAWYQFVAPEDGILRASTCSNFTVGVPPNIAIVTGECDVLSCVGESKLDYPYYEVCGSSVEFPVNDGIRYYVVLWKGTGSGVIDSDVELFQLDLRSLNPPDNDNCANAQTIHVDVNFTAKFSDVTLSPNDEVIRSCLNPDTNFYTMSGGIWYSFVGTGDIVVATSCSNDFTPFISIYTGSCGSLDCVGPMTWHSPIQCASYKHGQQSPPISTEKAERYFILVSGSGTISGTFDFLLRTIAPVENHNCTAALEIVADGQPIVGNTHGSLYDNLTDICQYSSLSPGAWYVVFGTGGLIRAESCLPAVYDPDVVIWVYTTSDCAIPRCAQVNDSTVDYSYVCHASTYPSSVVWGTQQDDKYYIRVSGPYAGTTIDFCLKVAPYDRPASEDCSDLSLYLQTSNVDLEAPGHHDSGVPSKTSVMFVIIMNLLLCGTVLIAREIRWP